MSNPLVSIITPSFNRASFIESTIRSVANQTYKDIEYIIIDGGSSDGTLEILEAYAQEGVLRFESKSDRGMYDAINKGLALSRGNIICYINTDDKFLPWTVKEATQYLGGHKDIDIVYGDTLVHDLELDRLALNILPSFSSWWLRSGGIIPQPTVFFRRRVYNILGNFQSDVKYLADCEYWLRADRAGMRFSKLNEVLAIETNHFGTIRQMLPEAMEADRQCLSEIYSTPLLKSPLLRMFLHRVKYIEKELLVLIFFLRNASGGGGSWSMLRGTYTIQLDILRYYVDKIFRTKSDILKLEDQHG